MPYKRHTNPPANMKNVVSSLIDAVKRVLYSQKQSISEYELMRQIGEQCGVERFSQTNERTELDTFQRHFLLMHALYLISDELAVDGEGWLEISALNIVWHKDPASTASTASKSAALVNHPVTRDYYLDLSNFMRTSAEDVADLLRQFWEKYLAADHLQDALQVLDIQDSRDTLNLETVRLQYKRLIMVHHPDRGGNATRVQEINKAMEVLEQYFRT